MNSVLEETKSSMSKTVEHFQQQLSKVRTGRATVSLLDPVKVDYYGTPTPLSQIGTVSAPDAKTLIVQPWERTMLAPVEKAIQAAGLGLNPSNDGTIVRVPIPPLTEERRKEFVKQCKKISEESKIAVRNVRRDHMEDLKKLEKSKEISEDDRKRGEDEIQKFTDKFIKDIDVILAKKEKEILED